MWNSSVSTAEVGDAPGREGMRGSDHGGPGQQAVFSRSAILIAGSSLTYVWQFIHFLKKLFFSS